MACFAGEGLVCENNLDVYHGVKDNQSGGDQELHELRVFPL